MKIKNTIMHKGKRMVCRIFDNGGASIDRYTIAFKGYHPNAINGYRAEGYGIVYPYLTSSENPFHPQGFGQYGESRTFLTGKHLGKRISFDSLPVDVQSFILQRFD